MDLEEGDASKAFHEEGAVPELVKSASVPTELCVNATVVVCSPNTTHAVSGYNSIAARDNGDEQAENLLSKQVQLRGDNHAAKSKRYSRKTRNRDFAAIDTHINPETGLPEPRDEFAGGYPIRRTHSLGADVPGRTRKLYCPRQPPTTLQRTLSMSTTNLAFKKNRRKLTSYQKRILICLALVSFSSFLCMSIIAPFFPNEASMKGMSETTSGFVFSIYALVIMVASPILGAILPVVGPKFLLISGIFLAGTSNIIFGVLDRIEDNTMFAVFCFVVRSFEALGAAAFSTASYTYIMYIFPDDVGTAFGLTETCVGLGMSLGPAIGGGLYAWGGYGLPFYVLGGLILLNIPFCWYVIKPVQTAPLSKRNQRKARNGKRTYTKLISIPEVAVVSLIVVVVSQSQGFLDPTIEPHFRQYGLGAQYVGLVFLLMSAAYAILSPITGWIAGKMENKFPLMIIGLILSTVGLMLLGPSRIIPLPPSLWLSTVAMVVMGVAYAVAFIPTFESILVAAINAGFPDNIRTYSLVSGLWSSMYSLGEVTGPSLGGIFVDVFDFPRAASLMAFFSMIAALVAMVTYICSPGPSNFNSSTSSSSLPSSSESDSSSSSSSSSGCRSASGGTRKTVEKSQVIGSGSRFDMDSGIIDFEIYLDAQGNSRQRSRQKLSNGKNGGSADSLGNEAYKPSVIEIVPSRHRHGFDEGSPLIGHRMGSIPVHTYGSNGNIEQEYGASV